MMPEHPDAGVRILNGLCLGCGRPAEDHSKPRHVALGDGPFFALDDCAIAYREKHGCGDEQAYCGSCLYERATFCLFTDGSGAYCGRSPGHDGKHAPRMTPTNLALNPRRRPSGSKAKTEGT